MWLMVIGVHIGLQLPLGNEHTLRYKPSRWRGVQHLLSATAAHALHAHLILATPLSSPHASMLMRPRLLIETLSKHN